MLQQVLQVKQGHLYFSMDSDDFLSCLACSIVLPKIIRKILKVYCIKIAKDYWKMIFLFFAQFAILFFIQDMFVHALQYLAGLDFLLCRLATYTSTLRLHTYVGIYPPNKGDRNLHIYTYVHTFLIIQI